LFAVPLMLVPEDVAETVAPAVPLLAETVARFNELPAVSN